MLVNEKNSKQLSTSGPDKIDLHQTARDIKKVQYPTLQ